MRKKPEENLAHPDDLWLRPRSIPKGRESERAWPYRRSDTPSQNRFLELADLALGLNKLPKKKKTAAPNS